MEQYTKLLLSIISLEDLELKQENLKMHFKEFMEEMLIQLEMVSFIDIFQIMIDCLCTLKNHADM